MHERVCELAYTRACPGGPDQNSGDMIYEGMSARESYKRAAAPSKAEQGGTKKIRTHTSALAFFASVAREEEAGGPVRFTAAAPDEEDVFAVEFRLEVFSLRGIEPAPDVSRGEGSLVCTGLQNVLVRAKDATTPRG